MNMFKIITLGAALIIALAACAGVDKKEPPADASQWLNETAKKYPNQRYLVGHGMGEHLAVAKQRARAELAKVFSVKVQETSSDRQLVSEVAGEQSMERKAERFVNTQTSEVLQGVQVAETWRDPNEDMYHALVILDRFNASEQLRKEIGALDEETAEQVETAQAAQDLLRTAAAAHHAYQAQVKRTALQEKLRVIDPAGQGVTAPVSLAKMRADFEEVVGRIRIMAESDDDKLQGVLSGGLSKAGFNSDMSKAPHYILKGTLDRTSVTKREGVYWLQGAVDLQLQDHVMGNQVVGTERWDFKITATDRDLVEKRLYDKLQQLNSENMRNTVLGFAIAQYENKSINLMR
jgi:hypothetical protein